MLIWTVMHDGWSSWKTVTDGDLLSCPVAMGLSLVRWGVMAWFFLNAYGLQCCLLHNYGLYIARSHEYICDVLKGQKQLVGRRLWCSLVVFVLNELLLCPRFAKLGIPVLPSEMENIIQFHSVACSPGYHTSFILPIVFSHLYFILWCCYVKFLQN
jgi:hypothetical protein